MRVMCLVLLAALLGGCSPGESENKDVLAPQREALERAEAVEQVLEDAAARQGRVIDDQGG